MDQSCESPLITSEIWVCGCHVMQTTCVSDCLSVCTGGVRWGCGKRQLTTSSGLFGCVGCAWAMSSPVTRPGVLWSDHRSTNRRGGQKDTISAKIRAKQTAIEVFTSLLRWYGRRAWLLQLLPDFLQTWETHSDRGQLTRVKNNR